VQALGGAKNFVVIMPDANFERSIDIITESFYGCAGERCLAGSVLVPVGEAHKEARERLVESARSLKVGDGLEPGVTMGPVISGTHRDRVKSYIDRGVQEGAKLVLDGRGVKVQGRDGGFFLGPTVFDEVAPDDRRARGDLRTRRIHSGGPYLDEGIADAGASQRERDIDLSRRPGRAREFARHATASMVGVNIGVAAPMAYFPFGGAKDSFFGDLKVHGRDAFGVLPDKRSRLPGGCDRILNPSSFIPNLDPESRI
jgi:malonate-semialdehyde dehydrogenase (acetylating)/methylmalonate-semialdehyde dehydrogenase